MQEAGAGGRRQVQEASGRWKEVWSAGRLWAYWGLRHCLRSAAPRFLKGGWALHQATTISLSVLSMEIVHIIIGFLISHVVSASG